jgi:hypothetical protein
VSWFVNLRGSGYGVVCDALALRGADPPDPNALTQVPLESLPALVRGKSVLLATHGFNVSYADGVVSLGRLQDMLRPGPDEVVLGVLWPGDWVIPAINYPFAEGVAKTAGIKLAAFCNAYLTGASRLSFASHSLGARVILQAVARLNRKAHILCIAAGAIGADCLVAEYKAAAANSDEVMTLSSRRDKVLQLAYPVGDIIADLLDLDHKPFARALGREGPQTPFSPPVFARQIPDNLGYDHGDYLPPSDAGATYPDTTPPSDWPASSDFIGRAFRQQPLPWPP